MSEPKWGELTEGFAMSVDCGKCRVEAEGAIEATVTLKNFGKSPAEIVVQSPWADYEVVARGPTGTILSETPLVRQRREAAEEGRRILKQIAPGDALQDVLSLASWFDLSAPGSYTFVLKRRLPRRGAAGQYSVVSSRPFEVVVTGR